MRLRFLRWRDFPGSTGIQEITNVRAREDSVEGGGDEPKNSGTSRSWEDKEMGFPWELL